jgi:hypothetical protein
MTGHDLESCRQACLSNGLTAILTCFCNCSHNNNQNIRIVSIYPLGMWTVSSHHVSLIRSELNASRTTAVHSQSTEYSYSENPRRVWNWLQNVYCQTTWYCSPFPRDYLLTTNWRHRSRMFTPLIWKPVAGHDPKPVQIQSVCLFSISIMVRYLTRVQEVSHSLFSPQYIVILTFPWIFPVLPGKYQNIAQNKPWSPLCSFSAVATSSSNNQRTTRARKYVFM